jgi:hypothetical protein
LPPTQKNVIRQSSKAAKPRTRKEEGDITTITLTSPSGSQQQKMKVSQTQKRCEELAWSCPFVPHSAFPVLSTSLSLSVRPSFTIQFLKDPARPFSSLPSLLTFKLSQTLLTASSPFRITAHHTASTFNATQEKEQEARKIRVVVIVAQDYFVFCKSCGLKKLRFRPGGGGGGFSNLQPFNDAVGYLSVLLNVRDVRADGFSV